MAAARLGRGGALSMLMALPVVAMSQTAMPSYYDEQPGMPVSTARSVPVRAAPVAAPANVYLAVGTSGQVEEGAGMPAGEAPRVPRPVSSGTPVQSATALPPRAEQGVKDLEAGMESLARYTATVAAHVKREGLRGFLAVPNGMKEQGAAVGHQIGSGVRGIASETATEMGRSDR